MHFRPSPIDAPHRSRRTAELVAAGALAMPRFAAVWPTEWFGSRLASPYATVDAVTRLAIALRHGAWAPTPEQVSPLWRAVEASAGHGYRVALDQMLAAVPVTEPIPAIRCG